MPTCQMTIKYVIAMYLYVYFTPISSALYSGYAVYRVAIFPAMLYEYNHIKHIPKAWHEYAVCVQIGVEVNTQVLSLQSWQTMSLWTSF